MSLKLKENLADHDMCGVLYLIYMRIIRRLDKIKGMLKILSLFFKKSHKINSLTQ